MVKTAAGVVEACQLPWALAHFTLSEIDMVCPMPKADAI